MQLSIAGLSIALQLPDPSWAASLRPRFGKFERASDQVELALHVVTDPAIELSPGGDPRVVEEADGLHMRHDNFHGFLPLPLIGSATLTIYQPATEGPDLLLPMVVDSLLRLALSELLAVRGGLMLHAAGIAVDANAGYVFFGPSGSGKTTICGLSHPRFRILCDEIIAVRPGPADDRLYGTPFNGAWGDSLAEDVPLRELFYLRQAPATQRLPMDPATTVRALLESAVAYRRDPDAAMRYMDLALALAERVPVTRLDFIPKETLWETVLASAR